MPLERRWQDYLDSWVIEARVPCSPEEIDMFVIAIAAELDRLRAIETAARQYVTAADAERQYGARGQGCGVLSLSWYSMEATRLDTRAALVKLLKGVPDAKPG